METDRTHTVLLYEDFFKLFQIFDEEEEKLNDSSLLTVENAAHELNIRNCCVSAHIKKERLHKIKVKLHSLVPKDEVLSLKEKKEAEERLMQEKLVDFCTVTEASKRLGIHEGSVRNRIRKGNLESEMVFYHGIERHIISRKSLEKAVKEKYG